MKTHEASKVPIFQLRVSGALRPGVWNPSNQSGRIGIPNHATSVSHSVSPVESVKYHYTSHYHSSPFASYVNPCAIWLFNIAMENHNF